MTEITIRQAHEEDAERLLEIYAYYIENTAITYEYEVPSVQAFAGRIAKTLQTYPYLTAETDGTIIGYAYAGRFHERAAYDWCAESSIYIDREYRASGAGRKLYEALEAILRSQNIRNLYACIAVPDADDEYLNRNSRNFHAHMGYRFIAEFRHCAFKFGKWYNMIWMEKLLGEHDAPPEPLIPYPDLQRINE
ncbi:MAG: GNAT family N-acetyltransferase [Eubacteriales bacterium]|nr:GNAT family N-acetyltransferase [Eubacteriales bacterium]